jgi:hypothetical protein
MVNGPADDARVSPPDRRKSSPCPGPRALGRDLGRQALRAGPRGPPSTATWAGTEQPVPIGPRGERAGVGPHAGEPCKPQPTDDPAGVGAEGQRVSDDQPQHRDQGEGDERLHDGAQDVLRPGEPTVEEGEARVMNMTWAVAVRSQAVSPGSTFGMEAPPVPELGGGYRGDRFRPVFGVVSGGLTVVQVHPPCSGVLGSG